MRKLIFLENSFNLAGKSPGNVYKSMLAFFELLNVYLNLLFQFGILIEFFHLNFKPSYIHFETLESCSTC